MWENSIVAVVVAAAAVWAARAAWKRLSAANKDDDACPTEKCSTCLLKSSSDDGCPSK